jgi:hypothetical protein
MWYSSCNRDLLATAPPPRVLGKKGCEFGEYRIALPRSLTMFLVRPLLNGTTHKRRFDRPPFFASTGCEDVPALRAA